MNNVKLPDWLRERMDNEATADAKSRLAVRPLQPFEDYYKTPSAFLAGALACYQTLLERGPEFDEAAAHRSAVQQNSILMKGDYVAGARWQHSRDQVALTAMAAERDAARAVLEALVELEALQDKESK